MKRGGLAVLIGGLLLTSCGLVEGQDGRYLDGMTYGPYRGRVIDGETKQALEGAVVVGVWNYERIYPLHSSTVRYATREAVTDGDGRFVIDAKRLEERAPRRTLHPYFVVFLPGYAADGTLGFPERVLRQGDFSGEGATVALGRLKTPKERLRQLDSASPYSLSEDPFKDIPLFVEAINRERINLGLQPYPPPGRRGQ